MRKPAFGSEATNPPLAKMLTMARGGRAIWKHFHARESRHHVLLHRRARNSFWEIATHIAN